ncbi:MAG: glycoside hydrolase domain-containing protein, partial [Sphingobacterium composti]
ENKVNIRVPEAKEKQNIKISFSAVSEEHAVATLKSNVQKDYNTIKKISQTNWENELSSIQLGGNNEDRKNLFYSLLYRTMQSPYNISEQNNEFKATDGKVYQATTPRYHGWAIWDNYKTQLPLLALLNENRYQDIIYSIANLYKYGKYDFAGSHEPANSVRTEHAAVVLLDAQNKNYKVPLNEITEKLIQDTTTFDFSKPDKFLEATYDMWAMSKLIPSQKELFLNRAKSYKAHWLKEFNDLSKNDVDRMSARKMYQGTIRQYRWNVPFDIKGLTNLMEGKDNLTNQLDDFFDNHYFNRANEPDIQSPTLYYASNKPWRYQSLVHELALDTVIQYYFNDNSRGIDPFIDRIYKNEPKAFIRTMDDDAGAMSGWFVLSAIGLHQPLIGEPIYYINVPFFPEITINKGKNKLRIQVKNFGDNNRFIKSIKLNNKPLDRLWVTHKEISQNAILEIEATDQPNIYGTGNMYVSSLDE